MCSGLSRRRRSLGKKGRTQVRYHANVTHAEPGSAYDVQALHSPFCTMFAGHHWFGIRV